MGPAPQQRVMTVDEYHARRRAGAFEHLDRVELIHGVITEMPPISPEQASTTDTINRVLNRQFGDIAWLRSQNPVTLSTFEEPIPDYALVHLRADNNRTSHPTPDEIYLLIEVADTTVSRDLGTRARQFAGEGIAEYWVILVERRQIVVHRDPGPTRYRSVERFRTGQAIAPLAFSDRPVSVRDLLGV